MKTDPFLGLYYAWDANNENFAAGLDANLQRIGALLMASVKSKALDIGDIVPVDTDRYIVPVNATGLFTGKDNNIAYYREGAWYFIAPRPGFTARVEEEANRGRWDWDSSTGSWQRQSVPEPGVGFEDAPADGKRYYRQNGSWVEFTDTESFVETVTIAAGTYTIQPSDRGKVLNFSGACTVTVPAGMGAHSVVYIRQGGASVVTLVADAGVTIDSTSSLTTRVAKSLAVLMWLFPDQPTFTGDIA